MRTVISTGLALALGTAAVYAGTALPNVDAARVGSFGLRIDITDDVPAYVRDNLSANETRYRARFHIDATALTLPDNAPLDVFVGRDGTGSELFRLSLTSSAGDLQLGVFVAEAGDPKAFRALVDSVPFPNQWNILEIDWQSDTSGHFDLWLNGSRALHYPVNNPASHISRVDLGAVQGLVAGMGGNLDIDEFVSQRQCLIGDASCDVVCMIHGVGAQWPNPSILGLVDLNNQVCP